MLRRSCVLVASIERRVSAHFFPSSFPTSFPSGCSPVLNRNNNNHASKWNVRTFSSFRSCLSENSSNKTSNRRAKKAPTTASQTSNRFHPCLDRFFFSTMRVYLLADSYSSLVDRWPAYRRRSPRLTQRNGRGQGITLDPEKERWRDIYPSNAVTTTPLLLRSMDRE